MISLQLILVWPGTMASHRNLWHQKWSHCGKWKISICTYLVICLHKVWLDCKIFFILFYALIFSTSIHFTVSFTLFLCCYFKKLQKGWIYQIWAGLQVCISKWYILLPCLHFFPGTGHQSSCSDPKLTQQQLTCGEV